MTDRPLYQKPPERRWRERPTLNRRVSALAGGAVVLAVVGAVLGQGIVRSSPDAVQTESVADSGGDRPSILSALRAMVGQTGSAPDEQGSATADPPSIERSGPHDELLVAATVAPMAGSELSEDAGAVATNGPEVPTGAAAPIEQAGTASGAAGGGVLGPETGADPGQIASIPTPGAPPTRVEAPLPTGEPALSEPTLPLPSVPPPPPTSSMPAPPAVQPTTAPVPTTAPEPTAAAPYLTAVPAPSTQPTPATAPPTSAPTAPPNPPTVPPTAPPPPTSVPPTSQQPTPKPTVPSAPSAVPGP
jgi:hypothetical protein